MNEELVPGLAIAYRDNSTEFYPSLSMYVSALNFIDSIDIIYFLVPLSLLFYQIRRYFIFIYHQAEQIGLKEYENGADHISPPSK